MRLDGVRFAEDVTNINIILKEFRKSSRTPALMPFAPKFPVAVDLFAPSTLRPQHAPPRAPRHRHMHMPLQNSSLRISSPGILRIVSVGSDGDTPRRPTLTIALQ